METQIEKPCKYVPEEIICSEGSKEEEKCSESDYFYPCYKYKKWQGCEINGNPARSK